MNKERLNYLDNLKIYLTILVVIHHVGQPYGGSNGFWYFISNDQLNLGKFFSTNAAFFMSLFFLISAYFLPSSVKRKGKKHFLIDRLIRLGIPLLFGFFILMPILMYFYYINFRDYSYIKFFDYYLNVYLGFQEKPIDWDGPTFPDMQFGHLWFIEHLLVYAVIYLFIIGLFNNKKFTYFKDVTNLKLLLFAIFISFVTFFVRIYYPIDHWEGLLGFIQVEYAHLPQYMAFFSLGIISFNNQWLEKMTGKVGITWLVVGITLALLRYTTNFIPYSQGGLNSENFYYSISETFLCFGLSIGLIYLFKKFFNRSNKLLKIMSENSYAVYIFHLPIAVLIQYQFSLIDLKPAIKFGIVSLLTITITYLFSIILRKFKIVRSII